MPIDLPEKLLRGLFATIVREGTESPSVFNFRAKLRNNNLTGTYNVPSAQAIRQIESALKKGPFPLAGMVPFGFEYWYNYFFKELPDLQKIRFAVHVINDDGSFRTESSAPRTPWKDIFNDMLNLGFKAFTTTDRLTASQALAHAIESDTGNTLQRMQVQVAFRGDGRLPVTIKQQRGTTRQSRVEALRTQRNMSKTWHPFNEQGHMVWVRKGYNRDNCLFSAVSITPQFGIATKFPLLDDLRGSNPSAIGYSLVRVRSRVAAPTPPRGPQVARRYLATVQQSSASIETRRLRASRTNVYCVRLRDVYNTQNYQGKDAFPEYAATRISWMDHLLWFAVTRIHFDERDGNAGHLVVITDHKWLQERALISGVLLNLNGYGHLNTFVTDIVRRGSIVRGLGGIIYTPPGVEAPFDIVSIQELFITG